MNTLGPALPAVVNRGMELLRRSQSHLDLDFYPMHNLLMYQNDRTFAPGYIIARFFYNAQDNLICSFNATQAFNREGVGHGVSLGNSLDHKYILDSANVHLKHDITNRGVDPASYDGGWDIVSCAEFEEDLYSLKIDWLCHEKFDVKELYSGSQEFQFTVGNPSLVDYTVFYNVAIGIGSFIGFIIICLLATKIYDRFCSSIEPPVESRLIRNRGANRNEREMEVRLPIDSRHNQNPVANLNEANMVEVPDNACQNTIQLAKLLQDPITLHPPIDPVTLANGHTYGRKNLISYHQANQFNDIQDPNTGIRDSNLFVGLDNMKENELIKQLVESLQSEFDQGKLDKLLRCPISEKRLADPVHLDGKVYSKASLKELTDDQKSAFSISLSLPQIEQLQRCFMVYAILNDSFQDSTHISHPNKKS